MRVTVEHDFKFPKKTAISLLVTVLVVVSGLFIYKATSNKNPLPVSVKSQLKFPAIYPKTSEKLKVYPDTINYLPSQEALSYTASSSGTNIVLTEQPASGDTSNPNLEYYQSLGLHPVTQIQTKLGLAVLVNFYDTGTFNSQGQNAILAKDGTLLIAHPSKKISPEDWKTFLNNLTIYK